jgi:Icc-related predicted phosphoesterase
MKLWILSDLHIEQSLWDLPEERPDHDVLVAAGDIHFAVDGVRWLAERSEGKPVIYVPGNHEWYAYKRRLIIEEELPAARKLAHELGVHFLWDDDVTIDGVRFLGTSLWTDYALYGEIADAMAYAKEEMSDHYVIFPRRDIKPLDPGEARNWHLKSRVWLSEKLQARVPGKTVVVTHHLPHPNSIAAQYVGDRLTPAFCSDLSEIVEGSNAALWIHGHTHSSCDYMAGATRVVCNPKGYGPRSVHGRIQNEAFNERLVIEI